MSNKPSSSYAYYSFPPTPNRTSPQGSRSNPTTPETARKSKSMAPSPAAGKTGDQPRTPTKLGRKPQSGGPPKLGQQGKSAASSPAPKPSQSPAAQKPDTDSPDLPRPEGSDEPEKTAEDASKKAEDAPEEASKVEMKDSSEAGNDEEDGGAGGKVTQAGENVGKEAEGDLDEQEPKPIDDNEDTTAGAERDVPEDTDDVEDTADDATEKAADNADDNADDAEEETSEQTNGVSSQVEGAAGGAAEGAQDTTADAQDAAGDAADDVQDAADDAQGATEDAQDTTEDAAKDTTGDTADGAEGAAETAEGAADDTKADAEDAADQTKEGAEDAADETKEGAEGAADETKDAAEDAADEQTPQPDLSVLKGLEVSEDGTIKDRDGKPIGRLVEGDAEDLVGYEIGDEGEILDDDGDLVGRCELLPEALQEQMDKAKEGADEPKLPGLEILEGLTVDAAGQVLNEDGDFVGQLVEGDPKELQGKKFNNKGEILDDDGNVIGRAQIHPDAAAIYDQGEGAAQDAADQAGEAADEAKDAAEEAKEGAEEAGVEAELPGVEALEGKELNEDGEIVDAEGNVLATLADGNAEELAGFKVNENGEVIDKDGNVVGKVDLAEGAADKLKGLLDLRILEGLKVNKKGKVLDEEGEEIGKLVDGDPKETAGKTVNDKGEVVDKDGKVIGRVEIVPGEAADEAIKALREKLGAKDTELPGIESLEGLKVNKKGQILNEDGDVIGELAEGEVADCAGKKVNAKGEVLDKDGKVVGKVKVVGQEPEEAAEGEQAAEGVDEGAAEGAAEDAGPELPPLSVLEGLKVNKSGKIVNNDGVIVGELVEGDAKKLSKSGITCDNEGQFWDSKGHVIGRAKTVPVEDPEEEAPFSGLEGLIVVKDGMVEDENGNVVGKVVEGDPKKLVGRAVDEDGDIIDKKGSVVGHAERYEEPEAEPEAEPEKQDLSILAGKTVNKQGNVIGDQGVPIARLVEGNVKECLGKELDEEGQIWNGKGKVIGRCELIPENERDTKPEGPFAGLQGLKVVQDGKIADEDGNIVGQIVEGNPKRLVGLAVDEDGDIIDKYGNVKGHAEPLEEEPEEAAPDLSILEGKTLNKQGFVVDDSGIPFGRLVEGNVKELAGRKCDGEGQIHNDTGKVVGRCELIPENERVAKPEGPFAGLEGLKVVKDGKVEDGDGNIVGVIVQGEAKKLIGHRVDEDGDIIDKFGNVKGHADPVEEEEEKEVDLSPLAGCTVNKAGNVVDSAGAIKGRVVEGDLKNMIGHKVDGKGQIWDGAGNVIGRAELVQGADTSAEGPFAGFDNITVAKDGTVVTQDGSIVGRIVDGDIKKLVGHKVDEDGDITDKNGNSIGKAERWEPEEKERRVNPMSGRRVNKEGEVRDENGELMGKLTAGDLGHCVGLEVDDNGYVVDNDGNKVGEVTLLENLREEVEEGPSEEDLKRQQDAELADKMANICSQTLERIQPVCKQITEVSFSDFLLKYNLLTT